MTIEEAIIWYKDLAELDYGLAESYHTDEGVYLEQETKCRERAENYEQLAEWLRELKKYRAILDELKDEITRAHNDLIESENEYGENARYTENDRGYLGGLLHSYEMFGREYEEVNADDCSKHS